MGYIIKDQLEIAVFINNKEYPLDRNNALNYLHISATVITKVPTVSLSITDVTNTIPEIGLQDGVPIRISVKALTGKTQTYTFRKFSHKKEYVGGIPKYIIDGYFDSPQYWAATSFKSIQGSSNDVISKIAGQCGLKYSGTATNDSQLWLPQNQSFSDFARDTALNGYISDTSCMVLALDLDGTLLYKNVNEKLDAKFKIIAYQYEPGAITAVDLAIVTDSGINNTLVGYQNMRYAQSTTQATTQDQLDKLAFTRNSRNPELNTVLKDKVGRGQVRFGPIDVGNVHKNYEKASYQNTRYKNMFSVNLQALINQPTEVRLLDGVSLSTQNEDSSQDVVNSGIYLITGKALYVQGSTYAEKFLLSRHGTNEKQVEG